MRFKNDTEKYREGTTTFISSTSKDTPECKFVSLFFDDQLKYQIAKEYGKTKDDIKKLEIEKIEIM